MLVFWDESLLAWRKDGRGEAVDEGGGWWWPGLMEGEGECWERGSGGDCMEDGDGQEDGGHLGC